MESPIDILPGEVLHNVFSKLSVSEKLKASIVCKKWLGILNCKSLLKDITVFINNNNYVSLFTSTSRNFLNFRFQYIVVDKKYYGLFKRFSPHVEDISFESCGVWREETITFEDLRFDNLKVLRIMDCDVWTLFPCLPNLKELYLTGNSTITDEGFAMLQKTMKHLEVLSLLCFISCEKKVIRRFYPQNMTYEINPSSLVLSFPAVYSFVSERASTLREIHLGYEITSAALQELSSIQDLCLYKIDLSSNILCVDSLISLFKNQANLKAINLSSMLKIDENIIDALCFFLPDIEEILLKSCKLTKMSKLFQLTKLNKLDISRVKGINADMFNEAILNFKAYQLKSLNLSYILYKAERIALDVLFQKCKYLVELDICNNEIPDCFIHSISKYLVQLESLCLKRSGITDYGLTGQREEHLFEETGENNHPSLSNLKSLRELNLNDCDKLTDKAVINTIKFKYLELLHVTGCQLEHDTVKKLIKQNPNIKTITWDDNSRNMLR